MAFVDDDQVEEVGGVLAIQAGAGLVLGNRLVDREVHVPALDDFAALDLVPGVAEGDEAIVLGVVHEDISVGQVEDFRTPVFAAGVPAHLPQPPANLEGDEGLAGAGRHGQQGAFAPRQDRLNRAVDGGLLVVARLHVGKTVVGRQQALLQRFVCAGMQPSP